MTTEDIEVFRELAAVNDLVDLFIERANQDDLDYLLSEAKPEDKEVLLYLTMHGALFKNLYLSKITTIGKKIENELRCNNAI